MKIFDRNVVKLAYLYLMMFLTNDRYTSRGKGIAIGLVEDVLFVVFTERKESLRLISARLATEKERRFYYDSEV